MVVGDVSEVGSESESDSELKIFSCSECSDSNLDTTFDFGTDSDNSSCTGQSNSADSESCVPPISLPDTFVSSNDESTDESDLDEEIWDTSGDEIWGSLDVETDSDLESASTNSLARRILLRISLFVTTFQLLFCISERAMSALLLFFSTLISFLDSTINHTLLSELCQILPKSMSKA